MGFFYYDLAFLILFILAAAIFLYVKRKNVQVESKVFLLYRTKLGLKIIDKLSRILPLNALTYASIFCGYAMMGFSFFLFYKLVEMMISGIVAPNIPPIMPLIPYMPALFKVTFLPPFYFTYWIISILIIAIGHEFSHGIFARFYRIKLKSTGFGFLGPFLAAFVELDERKMARKSNKAQLAILSSGPFANLILTFIFFILMNLFFSAAYAPAGVNYIYAVDNASIQSIEKIGSIRIAPAEVFSTLEKMNLTNATVSITANGTEYLIDDSLLKMNLPTAKTSGQIFLYLDSPALRAGMKGAITRIDSANIRSLEDINNTLDRYAPSQKINVETTEGNYSITLAPYPRNSSKAFLGISSFAVKESWLVKLIKVFASKKEPFVYYAPKLTGLGDKMTVFIYNLLFWIVLINFSVAFFNMVPLSVFDGGRFFYVTVLALTKSKKTAFKAFKMVSFLILLFFIFITAVWFFRWI
jgi:membrane-associated protease RseP (regulator of RpoE activity)